MNPYAKAGASTVGAGIDTADAGGFTAIASNGDLDRDGERIRPGCFNPLPDSIPVHLDHTMRAADVIARGRPFYRDGALMLEAAFTSTADAQGVRTKVLDGTLDSISIVFRGLQWEAVDGVRTCVKGELLAADIVSVPSNRGARVLSVRSLSGGRPGDQARQTAADALVTLARIEIAESKRLMTEHQRVTATTNRGPSRRQADALLREALNEQSTARSMTSNFLRSM